jgi:Fe-S cluster assembly protein SufD
MLIEKTHSLIENHRALRDLLNTYGPASLSSVRDANLERFAKVGVPTTRDEEFKYLPLHPLSDTEFVHAYGATVNSPEIEILPLGKTDAITLTFVNGEYAPELTNPSGLPAGAIVMSLRDALEEHADLVMQHLGKVATLENRLGSTNDERFVWLNGAYLGEGAFIFVPKGVVVEIPIHLRFVNRADHGPFAAHPRVLIVLEENAQAKVVESHSYLGGGTYFVNVVDEVHVGENAILEHVKFQNEGPEAIHIANLYAHQESGSTYTSTQVCVGGAISRADVNAFVDGEHCETWLNGAYFGVRDQIMDNHTRIDHAKPNCHSFEVYKGILDDTSVGVFNGKIFVYEDAQKTDAKQTNQALLLSRTATINTKPQLEIFADDVKCTHGATVGQIREDALFYLRSRGIPEADARKLLVYAFVAEVLEKISIDEVREGLEKFLFERLA